MKRIIFHWSAGTYEFDDLDKQHYHFSVDGNGTVHTGSFKPEDNLNVADGRYAAHTRGTNEDSIGVAICAMGGATQKPLKFGKWPIKKLQWDALVKLIADLAKKYKIPVSKSTVLSHAEVQKTLGKPQLGKWDISYLPFDKTIVGATAVGNKLRAEVSALLAKK